MWVGRPVTIVSVGFDTYTNDLFVLSVGLSFRLRVFAWGHGHPRYTILHEPCVIILYIYIYIYLFFLNRQILLNVIPTRRKGWTKQDTNGAAYRRYTITT